MLDPAWPLSGRMPVPVVPEPIPVPPVWWWPLPRPVLPGPRSASVGFVIKSRLYDRGGPSYVSCEAVGPPLRMPPPDVKESRVFMGRVEMP